MTRPKKFTVTALLISLPILEYLTYVFFNSTNTFFADDFHLLKTVLWVQEENGLLGKLNLLLQQHNEHRILFPRLLALLDYKIEGAINWRTLIMTGSILWAANIWFFVQGFKHFQIPMWMVIPIPFLLLQPQYTDNTTWSISILQQSVIVFWFSLLSYLCAIHKYRWTLVVAIVATFTHGNGICSFLIVIILAMADRKWRTVAVCVGVWATVGFIYFWDFRKGQSADFGRSLSDPVRMVRSFFAFLGAVTRIRTENTDYAVFLGFLLVTVLGIYIVPRLKIVLHKTEYHLAPFDKMLLGNVLFLGITASLVSVSRSWTGIANILAPRYQHYSPYLICWVYVIFLSFLSPRHRKIAARVITIFAVTFNLLSYFTYHEQIQLRKDGLIADGSNWIHHNVMIQYARTFNKNITDVYLKTVAEGICTTENSLPAIGTADSLTSDIALRLSDKITFDIDAGGSYPHRLQTIANSHLTGKTYLYLKSSQEAGYWVPTRLLHTGIREFIRSGRHYKPGFYAEFMTENLPPATYKIGILNKGQFRWTSRILLLR